MPADKYDGYLTSSVRKLSLELRAGHAGHLHIEQNTRKTTTVERCFKKLIGCFIKKNAIAAGAQQLANGPTERCVVIDNVDDRRRHRHVVAICNRGAAAIKRAMDVTPTRIQFTFKQATR